MHTCVRSCCWFCLFSHPEAGTVDVYGEKQRALLFLRACIVRGLACRHGHTHTMHVVGAGLGASNYTTSTASAANMCITIKIL
eukprot:5461334-Amphidinium_carterae.1